MRPCLGCPWVPGSRRIAHVWTGSVRAATGLVHLLDQGPGGRWSDRVRPSWCASVAHWRSGGGPRRRLCSRTPEPSPPLPPWRCQTPRGGRGTRAGVGAWNAGGERRSRAASASPGKATSTALEQRGDASSDGSGPAREGGAAITMASSAAAACMSLQFEIPSETRGLALLYVAGCTRIDRRNEGTRTLTLRNRIT